MPINITKEDQTLLNQARDLANRHTVDLNTVTITRLKRSLGNFQCTTYDYILANLDVRIYFTLAKPYSEAQIRSYLIGSEISQFKTKLQTTLKSLGGKVR